MTSPLTTLLASATPTGLLAAAVLIALLIGAVVRVTRRLRRTARRLVQAVVVLNALGITLPILTFGGV